MVVIVVQEPLPECFAVGFALLDFAVQIVARRERESHAKSLPGHLFKDVIEEVVHALEVAGNDHDALGPIAAIATVSRPNRCSTTTAACPVAGAVGSVTA